MTNLLKLGAVLNKTEQQLVKGGRYSSNEGVTVTCTFSDGTSWYGTTNTDFQPMMRHCRDSGGTVELSPAI